MLMGELTQENLEVALSRQRSQFLRGKRLVPVGEILIESRSVPRYVVESALTAQRRRLDLAKRAWRAGMRLGGLSARSELDALSKELTAGLPIGQGELEAQAFRDGYIAGGGRSAHWEMVAAASSSPRPEPPPSPTPAARPALARRKRPDLSSRIVELHGISVDVYSLAGGVEFSHAFALKQRVLAHEHPAAVIVDLSRATNVTIAAAGAIVDVVHKLSARNVPAAVVLPELTPSPAASVLTTIPASVWFVSLEDALQAVSKTRS